MNIVDHIRAGHYPVDHKERPLVPMRGGDTLVVCATDGLGRLPIIGFALSGKAEPGNAFFADSDFLLPPPPRKVEVKAYVIVYPDGARHFSEKRYPDPLPGWRTIELTGSYEEYW